MQTMTQYQARRHPVAAVLTLLVFGPFLLAGLTIVFLAYLLITLITLGRRT